MRAHTSSYRAFSQEGHLASSALLGGFESLNKLNYDSAGTVYSALLQLATGLERIMKIAFILHHRAAHDSANPSDKQLREFSHSLTELYGHLASLHDQHGAEGGWYKEGSLQHDVLAFLAEFAKGSRYYNLDRLVEGRQSPDPLIRWFELHMRIATESLSNRKRQGIMAKAQNYCDRNGRFGWEMGPYGRWDLTVDVLYQMEVARQSRGHLVWIIIELLRPVYDLIYELVHANHALDEAKGTREPDVPHMYEFFPFCLCPKETAVRRKAWTTLFIISGRV